MVKISGVGTEKLFNRFARNSVINYSFDFSEQDQLNFAQNLDTLLSERLRTAMRYGGNIFPAGEEWLLNFRANKLPAALKDIEVASQWTNFLADRVLAMDSIIRINNNNGKAVIIGVDITINPQTENLDEKLAKIRGQKTNPNTPFNANKNIPKVRQALEIDKHLILVLPGDTERFPSFDVILDRLHAAANEPAQTKLINLAELPLEQTLDWQKHFEQVQPLNLWKFYNNKFIEKEGRPATSSIRDLQKVASLAVNEGVGQGKIVAALQQSTWYKEQAASPRQKERDFADRTLGQMIEKLTDAKEMQSASKSIDAVSTPEKMYQPSRGELLRWFGSTRAAGESELQQVALDAGQRLTAEFKANGEGEVVPRDFSSPNVVVPENVRLQMERIVKEQEVVVIPYYVVEPEEIQERTQDNGRGR